MSACRSKQGLLEAFDPAHNPSDNSDHFVSVCVGVEGGREGGAHRECCVRGVLTVSVGMILATGDLSILVHTTAGSLGQAATYKPSLRAFHRPLELGLECPRRDQPVGCRRVDYLGVILAQLGRDRVHKLTPSHLQERSKRVEQERKCSVSAPSFSVSAHTYKRTKAYSAPQ